MRAGNVVLACLMLGVTTILLALLMSEYQTSRQVYVDAPLIADPTLITAWLERELATMTPTNTPTPKPTSSPAPPEKTPTPDPLYALPKCYEAPEGEACAPILPFTPSVYQTPTPYPVCQEEDYDHDPTLMDPCTKPTATIEVNDFNDLTNDSIGVISTMTPTPAPTSTPAPTMSVEQQAHEEDCIRMNNAPCEQQP